MAPSVEHPGWCARLRCQARLGGGHYSHPTTVGQVTLALWQDTGATETPQILLCDEWSHSAVPVPIAQIGELVDQITALREKAGGPR